MPPQLDLEVLREQVESLVRPGRMPSGAGGWLRIGKDRAHNPFLMKAATDSVTAAVDRVLLSVNQEGGRLSALDWPEAVQLPGASALGSAGSPELAEQAGSAIGGQLRAVGLTWNLAPVCDLATVGNPAVSGRAFSDQPAVAAPLAAAFVRGLQRAGVAGTAKHFPGLGGAASDPHLQTPVLDRLLPGALAPFEAAVEAGVASVMVGSHIVRDLDTVPALTSARIVGLLRDRIGFEGVIVSENLSIPGICNPLGGLATAALAAVKAGVDMVMLDSEISRGHRGNIPETGARKRSAVVDALIDAVLGGLLDPAQVTRSAARIAAMEEQFGLTPAAGLPAWSQANEAAAQAAEAIAAAAVRVPCGGHLLPLDLHGRTVALLRVPDAGERKADSARHAPDLLPSLLGEHLPVGSVPCDGPIPADAGAVVVYGYDTGRGPDGVSSAAAYATERAGRGVPVVQIALGDADELTGSRADVLIAAWSPHRATAAVVASLLTGRTSAPMPPAEGSRL
ncbi:glycoside hydrolase family 3 N-terminal domain-containing protein [Streptomyces sp. NPDC006670]|uniref:glycoside hydrolase family 3 N-terminal domain-containing protein n=1 Tax=Streptomyces sp. NPDC006670 TaxID=3154476 RepID=UPI0033FF2F23